MTLAYLQTQTNDGRAPLQRRDRMTVEQQETVAAHLRGDSLTEAQQAILGVIGTPQRLSKSDSDGVMIVEDIATGRLWKDGREHDGMRPSDNAKNGLPPPVKANETPNPKVGKGDVMSGNRQR